MAAGFDFRDELMATAKAVATPGKGILAADESTGTIGKRFAPINVENNEENRRRYRELLFTTEGLEEAISGVILYDETIRQSAADGTSFVDLLTGKGIIPGIKVDLGPRLLPGTDGETSTQGLDDLDVRAKEYYELGARFAKWRAVLKINEETNCPSELAIRENAYGLARYAAICQANGLVPIVEPEILMDGAHDLATAVRVAVKVQSACVKALHDHNVLLEGCLLKPNMIVPGQDCPDKASPEEIGLATVTVLSRTMPPALPGVNFLSGGMSEEEATVNLNAMNQIPNTPWNLSFSYGRALQASCLQAWQGEDANIAAAQAVLLERAKANGKANLGEYGGEAANVGDAANASTYVSNYVY